MATWNPKSTRVCEHAALRIGEDAVLDAAARRNAKLALLRRERRVSLATDALNKRNERTRRLTARRVARQLSPRNR